MKKIAIWAFSLIGKKVSFSEKVSTWAVLSHAFSKGFMPFSRGILYKLIIHESRGVVFVGSGVKILSPNMLRCGKSLFIGAGSYLDCFSVNGVRFGDRVTLRENAWMQLSSNYENPGDSITIGSNVYIGPRVIIGAAAPIAIGDRTQIGANVSIIAENHKFDDGEEIYNQGVTRHGISIGKDCWIGNNAIILDGVSIGDGCVIGAAAVVTKSIGNGCVVVGNPAKVIKIRNGG